MMNDFLYSLTVLYLVLVSYLLGYYIASIGGFGYILYDLSKKGVLYHVKIYDRSDWDSEFQRKKQSERERYFLTLRSAHNWATKSFCKSVRRCSPEPNTVVFVMKGGKLFSEFLRYGS